MVLLDHCPIVVAELGQAVEARFNIEAAIAATELAEAIEGAGLRIAQGVL